MKPVELELCWSVGCNVGGPFHAPLGTQRGCPGSPSSWWVQGRVFGLEILGHPPLGSQGSDAGWAAGEHQGHHKHGNKTEGKSRSWLVDSDSELKANRIFSFNFYPLVESGLFKDIFKDTFDALNFSPNRNNPEHFRFGKLLIIIMSCSAFLISSQC